MVLLPEQDRPVIQIISFKVPILVVDWRRLLVVGYAIIGIETEIMAKIVRQFRLQSLGRISRNYRG